MNILNLNYKIYGSRNMKQSEYVNFVLESIREQKLLKMNFKNIITNFDNRNKGIKF